MPSKFVELTIITDSKDHLSFPRKGLIRLDQITCVIDVTKAEYFGKGITLITLSEPDENYTEDDLSVVRNLRHITVKEKYKSVVALLLNPM